MKIIRRFALTLCTSLLLTSAFAQNILILDNARFNSTGLYAIDQKKFVAYYNTSSQNGSYNETAQVLCAANLFEQQVWMAKLRPQKWKVVYTAPKNDERIGMTLPGVQGLSVDNQGRCLFSSEDGENHLILTSWDTPVQHIRLSATLKDKPTSSAHLPVAIQSIIYHPQVGFLVMMTDRYAILPVIRDTVPDTLFPITPNGQVSGVTVYSFKEKGVFSPDGKTLYTHAEVINEWQSVFNALIALDVQSGHLKQVYLPSQGDGFSENLDNFETYASLSTGIIGMTQDGAILYALVAVEGTTIALAAIDTKTGTVNPLVRSEELLDAEFLGTHGTSNQLIFEKRGDDTHTIVLFDPKTKTVSEM